MVASYSGGTREGTVMARYLKDAVGFDAALRQLYLLAVEPGVPFDEKTRTLLALGKEALDLDIGIVSRVRGSSYECLFVDAPDWGPATGDAFDLGGTYCVVTLGNDGVTSFYHAGQEEISEHPCYAGFGLESYIGAPVTQNGLPFGTLNFSSREPRDKPFSEEHHHFVEFMSRWLSNELQVSRKQRELEEQKGLLKALIDAVPDGVLFADLNRSISMANRSMEAQFGYAKEQLIGRQTAIICENLDDYEALGERYFDPASQEAFGDLELPCRRSDGSTFPASISPARVTSEDGELLGYLGVVRDVTQQKGYEKAKDQLIATVSHEMRTPLTSLYGALSLMDTKRADLSPMMSKMVGLALRNAEVIKQMVADILDLEALEGGKTSSHLEQSFLSPLLLQSVETIAPFASEHGVSVKYEGGPATDLPLQLNPGRVLRLITNLASNAIKASPKGKVVRVGQLADGCGFWVRDDGAGIPADLQPVLFDRFTRGSTYRVDDGTGLGMSIVKAIVDQHLGEISFKTGPDSGTTFTVRFPPPVAAPMAVAS